MLEPSLDILYGLFLGLFLWGSWEYQTRAFKEVKQKEEDDKEFLIWVSRNVEWVVDDDDNWEFEISPATPNCIYVKTAQELRGFWEKNIKA